MRVLASQRVGNNVSSVSPLLEGVTRWRGSWSCSGQCLASWQGSGQGHGSQAVQAHHHLTSAHMPGVTRGSPGGTRGHQGGTSQCTGQADTRLRRRTSAQERYLTPAPAECGGAAAGRAGRAPHPGQLTPAPELGWWRLVAGCCGARPAAAAACVTAQLTYIQDTHPAAAHPGPAQCGRNHPDHPAVADTDIFEIMNNDTIARRMSVRNILQHPS